MIGDHPGGCGRGSGWPVDPGHEHVDERKTDLGMGTQEAEVGLAVGRDQGGVSVRCQELAEKAADVAVVVDHQHRLGTSW
jgi:hypothetical protein